MKLKCAAHATTRSGSLAFSFSTSYSGVVAFITVASEGSFAKAGDRLGIDRSAVSRNVRKLEEQLDVRLFMRTTRSTSLTQEGERFYEKCQPGVERIMQSLEDMRDLREGPPQGKLRISSPSAFGRVVVMPLLEGFRELCPEVAVDLVLEERSADFTSNGIDIAFRNGLLEDSQIVAKQLIPMELICCASPDYAKQHGLPNTIDELSAHECINYRQESGRIAEWEFKSGGRLQKVEPESYYTFNDLELVVHAVLGNQGVAQLPAFLVSEHLRAGRLVALLSNCSPDDKGHHVCYLSRQHLPARIRVFIDYITNGIRAVDLQYPTAMSSLIAGGRQFHKPYEPPSPSGQARNNAEEHAAVE